MTARKRDPFAGVVKAASAYPAWRALTKHEPAFFLSEKELRAACARMLRAELKRAAARAIDKAPVLTVSEEAADIRAAVMDRRRNQP